MPYMHNNHIGKVSSSRDTQEHESGLLEKELMFFGNVLGCFVVEHPRGYGQQRYSIPKSTILKPGMFSASAGCERWLSCPSASLRLLYFYV